MRALLVTLMMLATPALGAELTIGGARLWLIDPPTKYLKMPAKGRETVTHLPQDRLTAYCSHRTGKFEDKACASVISGPLGHTCMVTILEGMSPEAEALTLQHEIAHCRGWPADHPR